MERLLRRPEVEARLGIKTSTVYSWMAAGRLPRPLQIGPRAVGWKESDIAQFIESRAVSTGHGEAA